MLTALWKTLCQMLEKFCSKSDYTTKREKKWKSLFLQLVFENVDNSSDKLSVKFLPKIRKCLDPIPKKLEKFSKKIFLIEVFVSVLRKQFSHFCKKIIRKFRKCFDQNPEREEEVFKEVVGCTSYCSSERLESSSAKFAEYFLPKVGKKFAQISKKKSIFKNVFSSIKVVVWTRRNQFWQLCGKFWATCQKSFAQSLITQRKEKKNEKVCFSNLFLKT